MVAEVLAAGPFEVWASAHASASTYAGPEPKYWDAPQDFAAIKLRELAVWNGSRDGAVDVAFILRQGRARWTLSTKQTARCLGLKRFNDHVAGSLQDAHFMGYIDALGVRLDRILLGVPTTRVQPKSIAQERDRWGRVMNQASWESDRSQGSGSVEFPNGEYAEWWTDGPYHGVRWSCALTLPAIVDRADTFFSGVDRRLPVAVKVGDQGNRSMSFEDALAVSREKNSEVDFFRADVRDASLLWTAADADPPHQDNEFGETLIMYKTGARLLLEQLLYQTATPLIGGLALTFINQVEAAQGSTTPSSRPHITPPRSRAGQRVFEIGKK